MNCSEISKIPTELSDGQYGSGFRILKMGDFTVGGHTGSNDGWESALLVHQPTKSAIILLTVKQQFQWKRSAGIYSKGMDFFDNEPGKEN